MFSWFSPNYWSTTVKFFLKKLKKNLLIIPFSIKMAIFFLNQKMKIFVKLITRKNYDNYTYLILYTFFQLWQTLPVLPPLDFFKFSVPFLKSLEKNGKPRCGYRCQQQGDCPGKFLIRKKKVNKNLFTFTEYFVYIFV